MWQWKRENKRTSLRLLWFGGGILLLLALNAYYSYALHQYRTMYDNPVYRWRISVAVALSKLHDPALEGYVAYGSIADYLNQHGLALMEGEASPLPSFDSVRELIYDPDRLEKLFQEAGQARIDYSLPVVPIIGSEKGEAALYFWAFRLFGIHLISPWYLYFVLLTISTLAFLIGFWRTPICVLLLTLYLIAHIYMVGLASLMEDFQTVHNSRFLPVLALLPSLHLMVLSIRRAPLRLGHALLAAGQVFILFFVLFNRLEAAWQPMAIVAVSLFAVPWRKLLPPIWNNRAVCYSAASVLLAVWPGLMVLGGGAGLLAYQHVALDRAAYATESRSHTFWDPLVVGTISANSELTALYGLAQLPYSDTMGYFVAQKYLIDHNDVSSPIAVVKDGKVIGANAMHNMGAFDKVQQHVFFEILHQHPWLVVRSFVYDKPIAELKLLSRTWPLYHLKVVLAPVLLALAVGLLLSLFHVPRQPQRQALVKPLCATALVLLLSWSTTFIYPTPLIPDAIALTVMLPLMITVYAAFSFVRVLRRQRLRGIYQKPEAGAVAAKQLNSSV